MKQGAQDCASRAGSKMTTRVKREVWRMRLKSRPASPLLHMSYERNNHAGRWERRRAEPLCLRRANAACNAALRKMQAEMMYRQTAGSHAPSRRRLAPCGELSAGSLMHFGLHWSSGLSGWLCRRLHDRFSCDNDGLGHNLCRQLRRRMMNICRRLNGAARTYPRCQLITTNNAHEARTAGGAQRGANLSCFCA